MTKTIGILAIQGSFSEHGTMLQSMGVDFVWVKDRATLEQITHLIIPGGESTTMRKLLHAFDMYENLESRIKNLEVKVFGTCAGAILLSDFMDIEVKRNAYGGQQESFTCDLVLAPPLDKEGAGGRFKGVFIRAPKIIKTGAAVKVLASYEGEPVLVQQKNLIAATFHPEITGEVGICEYFLSR